VNKFIIISYTILENFIKVKISTHLCLHINQNWQLFSPSLGHRRIRIRILIWIRTRIQNSWFSVWGSGTLISRSADKMGQDVKSGWNIAWVIKRVGWGDIPKWYVPSRMFWVECGSRSFDSTDLKPRASSHINFLPVDRIISSVATFTLTHGHFERIAAQCTVYYTTI